MQESIDKKERCKRQHRAAIFAEQSTLVYGHYAAHKERRSPPVNAARIHFIEHHVPATGHHEHAGEC